MGALHQVETEELQEDLGRPQRAFKTFKRRPLKTSVGLLFLGMEELDVRFTSDVQQMTL